MNTNDWGLEGPLNSSRKIQRMKKSTPAASKVPSVNPFGIHTLAAGPPKKRPASVGGTQTQDVSPDGNFSEFCGL